MVWDVIGLGIVWVGGTAALLTSIGAIGLGVMEYVGTHL